MGSTGEEEAVALCDKIDIKEEPILMDPYEQPLEEIEQIYIKEENVKFEIPEDADARDPLQVEKDKLKIPADTDARDPLQVKKEECVPEDDPTSPPDVLYIKTEPEWVLEEETTSPPDVSHIENEPELQTEAESTSCGSEPGSNIPVGVKDDKRSDARWCYATDIEQLTVTGNKIQCSGNQTAFSKHKSNILRVVYRCNICKKTFAHLQQLKEHEHRKNRYTCDMCQKKFTTEKALNFHCTQHKGKCQKFFKHQGTLVTHSHVHTKDRQYLCDVCPKSFKYNSSLKRHLRVHTGERPYTCDVCQKTFNTNGYLKVHSRLHTGERPYSCIVCQKSFVSSSNLKKHSSVHTT